MTSQDERLRRLATAASALAGELSIDAVLEAIVDAATKATGARYAALGVIGEDGLLSRFIHTGLEDDAVAKIGHLPRGEGLLGLLIRDPQIIRLDDLSTHPASAGFPPHHPTMISFLGVPIRSRGRVYGNLYLTEKQGGFDSVDEELVAVLAAQAGAAIENAELAEQLQSLAVADERDRISRDLHDGVIQSLFSIGMGLESSRAFVHSDPDRVDERLDAAVDALDQAIRELRSAIYKLRPHQAAEFGLERGIVELAREYEVNALVRPELAVAPGLDASVPPTIVPDLLQILREVLSNAAKHAGASGVRIAAHPRGGAVELAVHDDGLGFIPGNAKVGRGLDNIRERAEELHAELEVASAPDEGTTVRVLVPIREDVSWSG